MGLLDKIADSLTRTDVLDLYFVITDLKPMHISEAERQQMAEMNAAANRLSDMTPEEISEITGIPTGKLVL